MPIFSGRQEILRDVLNVWARGVLQGRSLPSEAPRDPE